MSKRKGLFGRQPDMLLVDERPPGISLPSLGAAPLPELEDEPEDDVVSFTDEEDAAEEDSYDGGGPLRIFIGSPKKDEDAEADTPTPDLAALAPGPVWDASALAAGDDEDDAAADADDGPRGPVLVKPGQERPEPPPLTMSFGGSFSRGSMDAGVMDDDGAFQDDGGRQDTVVVHDQIYDRFLSLDGPGDVAADGPADAPPARDPDSDDEILVAAAADGEEEALGALPAMDEEDDLELPSVEDGPPPTRVLRVGLQAPPDEDLHDEDSHDEDSHDEDSHDEDAGDEDSIHDEGLDEDELFSGAHVSVGRARPAGSDAPGVVGHGLTVDDDGGEITEDTPSRIEQLLGMSGAHAAAAGPAPVDSGAQERTAPLEPAAETEVTAPVARPADQDWAERRRQAQAASAAFPAISDPGAPAEDEDRGGLGLLVVVLVGLLVVAALGWYFFAGGQGTSAPAGTTPTMQAPAAPTPPPAGDAEAPGTDGQGTDAQGSDAQGSDAQGSDAQGSDAQGSDGADAAPADAAPPPVGADAMPAEGTVDAALASPEEPTGVLRIRASRTARVYIDGEHIGETPMPAVDLPGGTHEVRVVAIDSGKTRTQEVRVDVGRSQEVRFSF